MWRVWVGWGGSFYAPHPHPPQAHYQGDRHLPNIYAAGIRLLNVKGNNRVKPTEELLCMHNKCTQHFHTCWNRHCWGMWEEVVERGKEGGTEDIGVNYRGRRRSSGRSRSKRRKILLWTVDFWAGARGRNIEVNYQTRGRRGVKVTGEKEASWGFLDKTDDEVWATCFCFWPSCAFPGTRSKLILHKHSLIVQQSASKYKRHLSDDFPELNIIKSHLSWAELGSTQKPSCVNSFNLVFSLLLLSVWPGQHTKCEKYTFPSTTLQHCTVAAHQKPNCTQFINSGQLVPSTTSTTTHHGAATHTAKLRPIYKQRGSWCVNFVITQWP